jgi:hypothetical protein
VTTDTAYFVLGGVNSSLFLFPYSGVVELSCVAGKIAPYLHLGQVREGAYFFVAIGAGEPAVQRGFVLLLMQPEGFSACKDTGCVVALYAGLKGVRARRPEKDNQQP